MKKTNNLELINIEKNIGKILRIGVLVSSTIIVIGMLILIFTKDSGYPQDTWPTTFFEIWKGVLNFKALAWIMGGLFLLILTPILRVVTSIFAFFKEEDGLYVIITTLVLIILIISVIVGHR